MDIRITPYPPTSRRPIYQEVALVEDGHIRALTTCGPGRKEAEEAAADLQKRLASTAHKPK